MFRRFLSLVVFLSLVPAASAQIGRLSTTSDQWLSEPYKLTVQLYVDPHPLMTPAFRSGLIRELKDTLQSDLGRVTTVEVSDKPSATMKDVVAKGWNQLDKDHLLNEQKTHYIRVLYLDGGQYEIQARQVDGYTGMVSPLRKAQTSDRLWVARQAALIVGQDFGMVGVAKEITGKAVRILIKGAKLGEPDSVRIRAGEVLAISEMRPAAGGKMNGKRLVDAYVYVNGVQEGLGEATTRLYHRFPNVKMDPPERGVLGFRVIKLGTCWAPLQMRIIDMKTREPIPGISISIARGGFDSGLPDVAVGATDAQGRINSAEVFRNVAFVRLSQGGTSRGILPLPLYDDRPIEFRLAGTQEADRLAEYVIFYNGWYRRMGDANTASRGDMEKIRELLIREKESQAAEEGNKAIARIREDVTSLRDGLVKLKDSASEAGERAVQMAAAAQKDLDRFAAGLAKFEDQIKEIEDPSPAARKIREGRAHETTPDPAKAIEAYEAALKLDPKRTIAATRLKAIKDVWDKKDPALLAARTYIFEAWPAITDSNEMERQLGQITEHLKTIEKHKDSLTALKLYRANFDHRNRMLGIRQQLRPETSENDDADAKQIDMLIEKINEMNDKALDLVGAE